MTSVDFYKRDTVIRFVENSLNQINQECFEGNHGILSVTDNGDYVTVKNRSGYIVDYDTQKLWDTLENFSQEDYESRDCYDLWDYLDNCEYIPEKENDNELKTDDELTFSEKRQVELVDWLLSEPTQEHHLTAYVHELEQENKQLKESIKSLAFSKEQEYQECLKYITLETAHFNKCIKQLQEEYQVLEKKNQELEQSKEYSQAWLDNLQQRVHDLECAVYLLQQENKQLKNQSEAKPEPQPEPKLEEKPTAKKQPKFKLPENFADYQQECNDLIEGLSCFYSIKKGKWGKDILQFILTPTDTEKAKLPYPSNWKAGLYLQPGQWTVDKVNLSDPDEWEEWFMDVNDFADANDIEIS